MKLRGSGVKIGVMVSTNLQNLQNLQNLEKIIFGNLGENLGNSEEMDIFPPTRGKLREQSFTWLNKVLHI